MAVALLAALANVSGCSRSHPAASTTRTESTHVAGVEFVSAAPALVARCHATARSVGYAVPCLTRVPQGLTETGRNGPTACVLHIIGPSCGGGGSKDPWRGWVVGSSSTPDQHLVLAASPRALHNDAKVVNGPAWYPTARVEQLARMTINGWRMHEVFVPPATNDGSAFAQHVVLIWTLGQHTYAVGFHKVHGVRQTLLLDEELARNIQLVRP
jgi:hypothetical protein